LGVVRARTRARMKGVMAALLEYRGCAAYAWDVPSVERNATH
jgi:hypothetical protein